MVPQIWHTELTTELGAEGGSEDKSQGHRDITRYSLYSLFSDIQSILEIMADHTCNRCQAAFSSRNKLYKHLKFCLINLNSECKNLLSDEEFHDRFDSYIYVTGGRLRGKTLGYVERFSLRRNCWETCPNMLENRYTNYTTLYHTLPHYTHYTHYTTLYHTIHSLPPTSLI